MENLIGLVIDNFKIVSTLGKGGMGIVYKAYDVQLDRYVAIKMMSSKLFDNERYIERFKREAKNQARINHPNIVAVYGFIEYSDLLGIVMEYVEGESLEKVLHRQKRFNIYDSIYILKQILSGLGYAHSKGFVHRDIKPSNIIFNSEGTAKIMDFGISKSSADKRFTKTGSKIGTVYYMSPEQIRGQEVDHHTDIYAMGCTLYEMLVGYPPYDLKSEYDVMDAHIKNPPPNVSSSILGSPEILDNIIKKAISKEPYDRYDNAGEFIRDLENLEKHIEDLQENYVKKEKAKTKKIKLFSVTGVIIMIILGLGFSWFIFNQVNVLLKSGKIEEFDSKHNIQSLFKSGKGLSDIKITKVETPTNSTLNTFTFTPDNNGVVLGENGTLLIRNNSVSGWEEIDINTTRTIYDGYFANGISFVVGDSSLFMKSSGANDKWRSIDLNGSYTLFRIKFITPERGFVLGSGGLVLVTGDGGNSWKRAEIESRRILYDISFTSTKKGFIVGWKGAVFETEDGGFTWHPAESFTGKYLKSIDFGNAETGIIVGGGGKIFRTENGGEKWYELSETYPAGLQKVKFLNEDNVLIAGNRGLLLFSEDAGETWTPVDTDYFVSYNDITVSKSGNVYVCGMNGTVIKIF